MRIPLALFLALAALRPFPADAALDCVVPTREEGFDRSRPGAEAVRRAALAAAAIVQKNAVFMTGNKPIRVRTSIAYYGTERVAASVVTVAYNRKAWLPGGCRLSPFADRGGGLADGRISLYINDPDALFGGRLGDTDLQATVAPRRLGSKAGFPVWAAGGNADNPRVLLSLSGYEPWVPVTIDEHLAWQTRTLEQNTREWTAASASSDADLSDSKIEEAVQSLQRHDAARAAQLRETLRATQARLRTENARQHADTEVRLMRRRQALEDYRATFSPAQLSAPTTLSTRLHAEGVVRVDDPEGRPLARQDPAFGKRRPDRVHFIVVAIAPQPPSDPDAAWQQASYEALDYAGLAALLSR